MRLRIGLTVLALAVGGVLAAAMPRVQPESLRRTPPQAARDAAVRLGQQMAAVDAMIGGGQVEEARAALQAILAGPVSRVQSIRAHQGLARCARKESDATAAIAELRAALAVAEQSRNADQGDVDAPMAGSDAVRAGLLMELADALAFGSRDKGAAIGVYDEVLSLRGEGVTRHQWVAATHTAIFLADAGQFAQAASRVTSALALPIARSRERDELWAIRLARAQWLREAGDLPGAFEAHRELWNEGQGVADPIMVAVGLQLASWYPIGPECQARLSVCQRVHEMIRTMPTMGMAWTIQDRTSALSQLEVRVLDSVGACAGAEQLLNQIRATISR